MTGFLILPSILTVKTIESQGGKLRRAVKGTEKVVSTPIEEAQAWFAFDGGTDKRRVGPKSCPHLIRTYVQTA